jgi:hypothetical protein
MLWIYNDVGMRSLKRDSSHFLMLLMLSNVLEKQGGLYERCKLCSSEVNFMS